MTQEFEPWNQHPRVCVLRVGDDYSQLNERERVQAAMAAILANVWIFNANTRARKEIKMGGHFYSNKLTMPPGISVGYNLSALANSPPQHPSFRCTVKVLACFSCGATKVGLLDGLCFKCRP